MGENITGTPVIKAKGNEVCKITLTCCERLDENGDTEEYTTHNQISEFITDGYLQTFGPLQAKARARMVEVYEEMRGDFDINLDVVPETLEILKKTEEELVFDAFDYEAAHKLHSEMGCICYENPGMGIYFIQDPDGYWLEIVPTRE